MLPNIELGTYCPKCARHVNRRCFTESQVQECREKSELLDVGETVYGLYITELNGILVEKGIGPVSLGNDYEITEFEVVIWDGASRTRMQISTCS